MTHSRNELCVSHCHSYKISHEILLNGNVFRLQTVFRLKTGEDDMLTRVIKLSIIVIKEVVVIILSNIT
jgi:hypothetical protein